MQNLVIIDDEANHTLNALTEREKVCLRNTTALDTSIAKHNILWSECHIEEKYTLGTCHEWYLEPNVC